MDSKKLSYRDIHYVLEQNGWRRNRDDEFDYHYYEMEILPFDYQITVRAWVSEDDDGLMAGKNYGVSAFEIVKVDGINFPFGASNLKEMLYAIELAKDNLLTIGVPFADSSFFHGRNAANKKRRNNALRKKFNLDDNEIENYTRILKKQGRSDEEISRIIEQENARKLEE